MTPEPLRILCYGDSNTWGYRPGGGPRFRATVRWPGVLQSWMGKNAVILEEGLNGRTTMWDDPLFPGCNGRNQLLPILTHHAPLDVAVILLGTNDLKARFKKSAASIAKGAGQLCQDIVTAASGHSSRVPEILLVAPPPILHLSPTLRVEFEGAVEKSKLLAALYSETAELLTIHFMDANKYIAASRVDSVHWDSASHQIFGKRVAEKITAVFTRRQP